MAELLRSSWGSGWVPGGISLWWGRRGSVGGHPSGGASMGVNCTVPNSGGRPGRGGRLSGEVGQDCLVRRTLRITLPGLPSLPGIRVGVSVRWRWREAHWYGTERLRRTVPMHDVLDMRASPAS